MRSKNDLAGELVMLSSLQALLTKYAEALEAIHTVRFLLEKHYDWDLNREAEDLILEAQNSLTRAFEVASRRPASRMDVARETAAIEREGFIEAVRKIQRTAMEQNMDVVSLRLPDNFPEARGDFTLLGTRIINPKA